MEAVTGSVAEVKRIVEGVREASEQQTMGIEQVAQAIVQMEKVTQTTAATAEEGAAASEELNAQAESSMEVVRRLGQMIGGAQTAGVPGRGEDRLAPKSRVLDLRPASTRASGSPGDDEAAMARVGTGTYGRF
jgi:hypothetical protein